MSLQAYPNPEYDLCKICGDYASGYNFNVLTCESCRAFFRRNALKTSHLRCRHQGNCDIIKSSRSFCRYCRLQKCFQLGMMKEWILSDEQRQTRKIKWQRIKAITTSTSEINLGESDNKQGEADEANQIIYSINKMYETIDQMLDFGSDQSRPTVIMSSPPSAESSEDNSWTASAVLTEHTVPRVDSAVTSLPFATFDCLSLDYNTEEFIKACPVSGAPVLHGTEPDYRVVPVYRPITDYRNNLTESEGKYLTELLVATNLLKTPIGTIISEALTFNDAIQALHFARVVDTQSLIAIPRSLLAFKEINPRDRCLLMEQGVIKIHHFRNVAGYFKDNNFKYVIVPTVGDQLSTCLVPLDVMRQTKPYLYSAHIDFFEAVANEWDKDYVILIMLSAIILFTPDATNDYQTISEKQLIYKHLLRRYLVLRYRSEEKANEKFGRLMYAIDLVNVLNEKRKLNAIEENYYNMYQKTDQFTLFISSINKDMHD